MPSQTLELADTAQRKPVAAPPCRFCGAPLTTTFVDLGMSPLCENVILPEHLDAMEPFYPLHVRVCDSCLLVQLPEYVPPEDIFTEYAYFSGYSDSWVAHARRYVEAMIDRYGLTSDSLVVEIASNDGYLLQHFVERDVPVLGVEPAANVAAVAEERGVRTVNRFFGAETARDVVAEHGHADLMPANNVLAHVPDINDFVQGVSILIGPRGVATFEFPHLLTLIEGNEFDTIYHEHYSYLALVAVEKVLAAHGLKLVDVEEIPTHGGSLRLFVRHVQDDTEPESPRVEVVREKERAAGLHSIEGYRGFGAKVLAIKRDLMSFLLEAQREGKHVVGYGAPGKGNTLLNYCAIRSDLLAYTVDRNPYKQAFLPGTHIPVHDPSRIAETRPDYIVILPWNLRKEIGEQLAYTREWGAKLVVPIPRLEVF
jgi:C-methyltransferase C-terminal domain/Putative zinc binding domain/Methyltransferase domain